MIWHPSQQALRGIYDGAQHDEVEVKPSTEFWNPTQGRRNGPDNERPNFSSNLTDKQHEGAARDIWDLVRMREVKCEMLARSTKTCAKPLYKVEPAARHSDMGGLSHDPCTESGSAYCKEGV